MTVLETIFAYLAEIPTEIPDPSAATDGYVLTAASGEATWAAIPAET